MDAAQQLALGRPARGLGDRERGDQRRVRRLRLVAERAGDRVARGVEVGDLSRVGVGRNGRRVERRGADHRVGGIEAHREGDRRGGAGREVGEVAPDQQLLAGDGVVADRRLSGRRGCDRTGHVGDVRWQQVRDRGVVLDDVAGVARSQGVGGLATGQHGRRALLGQRDLCGCGCVPLARRCQDERCGQHLRQQGADQELHRARGVVCSWSLHRHVRPRVQCTRAPAPQAPRSSRHPVGDAPSVRPVRSGGRTGVRTRGRPCSRPSGHPRSRRVSRRGPVLARRGRAGRRLLGRRRWRRGVRRVDDHRDARRCHTGAVRRLPRGLLRRARSVARGRAG